MVNLKIIWMNNDYSWENIEITTETTTEAEKLSEEASNTLNILLNKQFIKDYRVEY